MRVLVALFVSRSWVRIEAATGTGLGPHPIMKGLLEVIGQFTDEDEGSQQMALEAAMTAAADEEGVGLELISCDRDFSGCPVGWSQLLDGACGAPATYQGSCPTTLSFAGLAPKERAAKCGDVEFPCRDLCTEDPSQFCPEGWHKGGPDCFAPAGYSGPCVGRKSFITLGTEDRRAWGKTCGVRWPCRGSSGVGAGRGLVSNSTCTFDYTRACPSGWTKSGTYCRAPADDQTSLCGVYVDTNSFTAVAKHAWASACAAPWPCVES